ncbi:hypothetical protein RIF29_29875 [Crotalaria pallida]|uniref:Uncharacterized protein n=1 Tax=Crotalaria pallida TaxID=3830 RepID=A0AAN9EG78_CROPI
MGSTNHTHILSQEEEQQHQQLLLLQLMEDNNNNNNNSVDPTEQLSMLHLNHPSSSSSCHVTHHPACCASLPMKRRRSPLTSSAQPTSKKLFSPEQEDPSTAPAPAAAPRGYSAITLPLSLGTLAGDDLRAIAVTPSSRGRVLRRCVSDPCRSPEAGGLNPANSPARGCGLPPLPPPCLKRSVSDLSPSPAKAPSHSFDSDEATDSMRLRRMKDRLREMRQWCDEVMKVDEDEQEQEVYECAVADDDKVLLPPQDELKGDSEEAVKVEWAEKCVKIIFRCPCGKGYEVLINANNCYYKLV